jgi:hypothetical protein
MRQTRDKLSFPQKAAHVFVSRKAHLQDFESHQRFEIDVLSQVDIGKPTPAEKLNKGVIAKSLSSAIRHPYLSMLVSLRLCSIGDFPIIEGTYYKSKISYTYFVKRNLLKKGNSVLFSSVNFLFVSHYQIVPLLLSSGRDNMMHPSFDQV